MKIKLLTHLLCICAFLKYEALSKPCRVNLHISANRFLIPTRNANLKQTYRLKKNLIAIVREKKM